MAQLDGQTPDSLATEIVARPHSFDFFRAVRALEADFRTRPRVGYSQRLEEDFLRFCQVPSLSFAPSTLESVEQETGSRALRIVVNFLGMFGPNGPLPQHLTDFARDRHRNAHDRTLVRFMDIFHHRMLSFFYRAWAANQKTADFDRPEESRFAGYFGSLFGMGMPTLWNRDTVPDVAKIYFSGRLATQTRNAEGLEAILEDYFGLPAGVQEFSGYWMPVPRENQLSLGASRDTGELGINAVVGERKFEGQLKFRIRMGPMEVEDLRRLLPNGPSFRRLKDWVLNYIDDEFYWDVQCVLKASAVPATCLGQGALLGWITWLKSEPFQQDTKDPIFNPEYY